MCLDSRLGLDRQAEILNHIDRDGITVFKIVGVSRGKYYPVSTNTRIPFDVGVMKADTSVTIHASWTEEYKAGFHFFLHEDEAIKVFKMLKRRLKNQKTVKEIKIGLKSMNELYRKEYKLIECQIKKSWIKTLGIDGGTAEVETAVTNKAIFPDPKEE